jgi:hypothetical protein
LLQLGVEVGAARWGDKLLLTVQSGARFVGAICFDGPRGEHGGMTIDWARINEMPHWWEVQPEREYSLQIGGQPPRVLKGQGLIEGVPIDVAPDEPLRIEVRPLK